MTSTAERPCAYGYHLCGNFKINVPFVESKTCKAIQNLTTAERGLSGQSLGSTSMPNTPLSYYANTTETMDYRGFTQDEVNTSMTNMMNRWGIIKAFRYMRITNTAGAASLFFTKLGLYSTKSAAKAETGSGIESCIKNITTAKLGPSDGNRS